MEYLTLRGVPFEVLNEFLLLYVIRVTRVKSLILSLKIS